jgi:hypothetical protein
MLRKLIVFAVTSGLAKKAWDHYRDGRRRPPEDITDVVARPAAEQSQRASRKKSAARRKSEGPSA